MKDSYINDINKIKNNNIIFTLYPIQKFYIFLILISIDVFLSTINLTKLKLPFLLFPYFFFILLLFKISNLKMQAYKQVLRILYFSFLIFLFQILLIAQGNLIFSYQIFHIYSECLKNGIKISMNTLNIASIFLLYFQTTSIENFTVALNQQGINHKVSFTILSTFQMINNLSNKIQTIITSQKSRGIDIDGNPIQRMKSFIPVLFPAFITSLVEVENQVISLESRNFFTNHNKTFIKKISPNGYENILLTISISIIFILIIGRIFYEICL